IPPKATTGGPPNDECTKLARWVVKILGELRKKVKRDPEEERRRKEVDERLSEAAYRAFGRRLDKMWLVEGLWTTLSVQGNGYGGMLLDAVTALVSMRVEHSTFCSGLINELEADWAGESTWLQSSNIENTRFYDRHGFQTVETVLIGENNPTWHKKPVPVSIMIREPRWPPSRGWLNSD
ncbi:hypothetical protein H0H81_000344, partial [Sphagnurus paluster]